MDRVALPIGVNESASQGSPFPAITMPPVAPTAIQGPVDILVPSQPMPGGPSAVIRPRPVAGWPSAYPAGGSLPPNAYASFSAPSAGGNINGPLPEIPPPWMAAPYLYGIHPPAPPSAMTPPPAVMPAANPLARDSAPPPEAAPPKPSPPGGDDAATLANLDTQLNGIAQSLQSENASEPSQRQGISTSFIKFMTSHADLTKPGHPLRDKIGAILINMLQDPDGIVANAALTVIESGGFYEPTDEMKTLVQNLAASNRMEGILATAAKNVLASWHTYTPAFLDDPAQKAADAKPAKG